MLCTTDDKWRQFDKDNNNELSLQDLANCGSLNILPLIEITTASGHAESLSNAKIVWPMAASIRFAASLNADKNDDGLWNIEEAEKPLETFAGLTKIETDLYQLRNFQLTQGLTVSVTVCKSRFRDDEPTIMVKSPGSTRYSIFKS